MLGEETELWPNVGSTLLTKISQRVVALKYPLKLSSGKKNKKSIIAFQHNSSERELLLLLHLAPFLAFRKSSP